MLSSDEMMKTFLLSKMSIDEYSIIVQYYRQ